MSIANYLKSVDLFDEALEFYSQVLNKYQTNVTSSDVAFLNHATGCCYLSLLQPGDALKYLVHSHEIKQELTPNAGMDMCIAVTLHEIGCSHINMHNYKEALASLNRSLQIKQDLTQNANQDESIAMTLHEIGRCHNNMNNCEEALFNLN